ncbi:unnamed protein product [Schistocephalus solidus]|uniref:YHYH domain-containing protein n=1 Tax=Schistocephalus solidus TaxID=70667 RepID=A0A183SXZ8_SCHSO|nr:unnamed protein product [Schistocephalus solidus]
MDTYRDESSWIRISYRTEEFLSIQRMQAATLLLVLLKAAIIPDLAGLDDVKYCTSPRVTIRSSIPRHLNSFFSPATDAAYHFHVLPNPVYPGFWLTCSSTPPSWQRRRLESSRTELVRPVREEVHRPPQSSFLDGLRDPRDIVAVSSNSPV